VVIANLKKNHDFSFFQHLLGVSTLSNSHQKSQKDFGVPVVILPSGLYHQCIKELKGLSRYKISTKVL